MNGKFSNININPQPTSREVDPLRIFQGLTLRGDIENIWTTQTDALQQWHAQRAQPDQLVQMNTGGGKTLVGLLIAKSLCNELRRPVLYVCPTKQLIEQTRAQASACGIETAAYMSSQWTQQEVFDDARGPCVTTYAAVFNGRSKFFRENIGAIIFDDAHVAYATIRDAYTIKIPRDHDLFQQITNLFTRYFLRTQSQRFRGIRHGVSRDVLIVPNFELRPVAHQVANILYRSGIANDENNQFPWRHLQNNISDCVLAISDRGLEISPAVVPVTSLPYFSDDVRRLYLTATAPSGSEFYRTFGGIKPAVISPSGKLGDAQRLIGFLDSQSAEENRQTCLSLTEYRKAAIIVPSRRYAEWWSEYGQMFATENGQSLIEDFSQQTAPKKLILVARFDGIDLPGKACQILILDGVPSGSSLIDRFATEMLRSPVLSSAHVAVRVIQGMGRIFRSNTDHGVVLIPDPELQRWLRSPNNRRLFPELLQRQILFGIELGSAVSRGETTWDELMDALLRGDKDWDHFYETHIAQFQAETVQQEDSWLDQLVADEHAAYQRLWAGDNAGAATEYEHIAAQCGESDSGLSAWLWHWAGAAWSKAERDLDAMRCFVYAANLRSGLGRPRQSSADVLAAQGAPDPTHQASNVAALVADKGKKIYSDLGKAEKYIKYGPDTSKTEEGIRILGDLLGLAGTRPDSTVGDDGQRPTGPDVLWRHASRHQGVAFECKTDKGKGSSYRKRDDIGQVHDHIAYLGQEYPDDTFRTCIVGRFLPVSTESHPPPELRIVGLEDFFALIRRIQNMYENLVDAPTNEPLDVQAERWLSALGLKWPHCVDNMQYCLATELQRGP